MKETILEYVIPMIQVVGYMSAGVSLFATGLVAGIYLERGE